MGDNLYQYVFDHMILCAISHMDFMPIRILIWTVFRLSDEGTAFLITCLWFWSATDSMTIYSILTQFTWITLHRCNISMPMWFVEILILWTWLTLQTCIILHFINILISFSGIDWIISKESFRFPIHIIRMLMLTLLCSYVFGRKNFFESYCKPL